MDTFIHKGIQIVLICVIGRFFVGCGIAFPEKSLTNPFPTLPPSTKPFVYRIPETESLWASYNSTNINGHLVGPTSVMESSVLRLEVRKTYGASIQIYDKVTNQPLINFKDMGRESGMSSYGGPRSFSNDALRWRDIGYNPLQAGDDGGNPSPILFHGFVDGWIYTKAQCLSWPHQNARRLPFFYEQWVRVEENKVHVKVRLTHQRDDKMFYGVEAQEWPMMMINGARKVHFYNGDTPYTYDQTTITDGIESRQGPTVTPHDRTPFGLTEPWQGVEIGSNRLIGLYTPGYYWGNYNVDAIAASENWEGGSTITYTANLPMIHLDSDNVWVREYTYIIGTEQEIRDYVYAQERFDTPYFIFNTYNGRSGWSMIDGGYDQKEPFQTNDWKVTVTGKSEPTIANGAMNARQFKLASPFGNWKASNFKEVYIQMAYTGPPGASSEMPLRLSWVLNRQTPEALNSELTNQNNIRFPRGARDPFKQSVIFNVKNDGQFHTYKVSFPTDQYWTGIIQRFEIAHTISPDYIPPGEVITLRYFGSREIDK